jgi:hypothetical protein
MAGRTMIILWSSYSVDPPVWVKLSWLKVSVYTAAGNLDYHSTHCFYIVALANYVHGKNIDKGFIRIDMSEFQHKVLQTLANF